MGAFNEVTHAEYTGKNPLLLMAAELEHGFDPEHGWAGYSQWQKAGRQVLKGQHSTQINRVVLVKDRHTGEERQTRTLRRVFHFDQTAAIADLVPAPGGEDSHLEMAYEDRCAEMIV
jgi:antirestriction protein ArdC